MLKRILAIVLAGALTLGLAGCSGPRPDDDQIVIYSSSEEFRNEHIIKRLREQFPYYNITLQYISTGKNGAKLKSEGKNTEADIIVGLETSQLNAVENVLEDLSEYDTSNYLDELLPKNHKYLPWERFGGTILVNRDALEKYHLPMPRSYDDLLRPEYKGYISVPNPKLSSTGYMFLISMINSRGEDAAYQYFDRLAENTIQFTSSGSGPVNALVQGEAAIGLGLIFQGVQEANKGCPLEILRFPEGIPYAVGGMAVIEGRLQNPKVKEVFDFIANTLVYEDKELYSPEQIFKGQKIELKNFPADLTYADMRGLSDVATKERLMEKWMY